MKYVIRTTEQADADLRRIYEYIAFTLLAPEVAAGQLERIEKGIAKLEEMPNRFRAYEEEPWRGRRLRWMPVDNFIVFYLPQDENKTVTVTRILYGGRNIDEWLRESERQKSKDENGWRLHEDMKEY